MNCLIILYQYLISTKFNKNYYIEVKLSSKLKFTKSTFYG